MHFFHFPNLIKSCFNYDSIAYLHVIARTLPCPAIVLCVCTMYTHTTHIPPASCLTTQNKNKTLQGQILQRQEIPGPHLLVHYDAVFNYMLSDYFFHGTSVPQSHNAKLWIQCMILCPTLTNGPYLIKLDPIPPQNYWFPPEISSGLHCYYT